jgi:hypothetical protein
MNIVHADLEEAAEAAAIVGPNRYRLLDSERKLPSAAAAEAETMLLRSLESEIYYRLYRRPGDARVGDPPSASLDVMRSFTAAVSAANRGAGTWDPGWQIEGETAAGDMLVRRDGITYRTPHDQVRRGSAVDGRCRVRVPNEMRQLVRGFYMALGDADWPERLDPPGALLRFYWSLSARAAPLYLEEVTRRFNALEVPFRTKVMQDPSAYRGADAGVLYLPAGEIAPLWPELAAIYRRLAGELRPQVPLFTHRLAPGLGFAEDPGGGMSFGQARCGLVARGLLRAFHAGENDARGRAVHVAEAFRQDGIDPAEPFRSHGSACPVPPSDFAD